MFQIKGKILYNKKVKGSYFHLALEAPDIAKESLPGQFLNIKVSNTYEPLLRRPLSIHSVRGRNIEVLYEVVGKGTKVLSEKGPGEVLDVIGPLGNGFTFNSWAHGLAGSRTILIGGGMGVAPLVFLADKIAGLRARGTKFKAQVLIGAKTKGNIICEKEFKDLGCSVKSATDDGSYGFKGRITDLLKNILRSASYDLPITIYACGPRLMLKEISAISRKYGIPAQISLEEHMACGIGACLGCVVNTKQGLRRVCKDGPVFNADEINWK
ncbi:MAG: dihydroorotate dehydrogenase electron transfer subunit [Candidatus Omnitrophota bacterium]